MMKQWRSGWLSMTLRLHWNTEKVDGRYCVEFPRSCVLYLRSGKRTPDFLEVELILPDSQMCVYRVPTVKVEHYTKDSILRKSF